MPVVCRVSSVSTIKSSSHMCDTTRQHATRPVLQLPIQSNVLVCDTIDRNLNIFKFDDISVTFKVI